MEKQWDLVRYHWELDEDGLPHLHTEAIVEVIDGELTQTDRMAIVTNYVNKNEPHAKDFRWCNTTGDDDCWEYYQYGVDSLLTPVYGIFPTSERGLMVKG